MKFAGHVSALVSLAGILLLPATARAAADSQRFCSPSAVNIVVYLDVTTPYDDIDKRALIDGVGKIFEKLTGGERIAIRTIADTFTNSSEILDECMPYCESQGFLSDLFSDCTEGVVINERKRLKSLIVARLSEWMGRSTELKYSEILRTIAMSASEEYRDGRDNQLFIFSDLIENSEYLSGAKFFAMKNNVIVSDLAKARLVPNLKGATVVAFGVGRTGNPTDRRALSQDKFEKLADFWETYFSLAGAALTVQQTLSATQ